MPDMTVHVPSAHVQDLAAAVAQAANVPLPPTNQEKLDMVQHYTQKQLQTLTSNYRGQQTGAAANSDSQDDDWTVP
jgi:hypothetical protein